MRVLQVDFNIKNGPFFRSGNCNLKNIKIQVLSMRNWFRNTQSHVLTHFRSQDIKKSRKGAFSEILKFLKFLKCFKNYKNTTFHWLRLVGFEQVIFQLSARWLWPLSQGFLIKKSKNCTKYPPKLPKLVERNVCNFLNIEIQDMFST